MWRAMSLTRPRSSVDHRGFEIGAWENGDVGVREDDLAMCDRSSAGDDG